MGNKLYTIKTEKNKISKEIEKDSLFDIDIKQLIEKIEDTATLEEIQDFYHTENLFFPPMGLDGNLWEYRKQETTPRIWRGVYKYADIYGELAWYDKKAKLNYDGIPGSYGNNTILDFGIGGCVEPNNEDNKYYLIELNDWLFKKLKEFYKNTHNFFIYQNLSDVLSIKFDLVWSHDVLEHVRLLSEHLNILYRLCNDGGILDLYISSLGNCGGGHVYGNFKDTFVRHPYNLIFQMEPDV